MKISEQAKLQEKMVEKNSLLRLNQDFTTKLKQFKKFKYFIGPLNFLLINRIKKLKIELGLENEKGMRDIGTGSELLIDNNKSKLKNYDNYLVGTDSNLRPIFVNNLNQHLVVFGASGSGKSVFLFNLLRQTLDKNGGAVFIDGKGDLGMFKEFLAHAMDASREKDIYVLNFNKNNTSNVFNPFESLSLSDIESIIINSSFDSSGGGGDFFVKQAMGVLSNAFGILSYLKEVKKEKINLSTLTDALELNSFLVNLVPPSNENPQIPDEEILKLNNLEGYRKFWIPKGYDYNGIMPFKNIKAYLQGYGGKIRLSEDDEEEDNGDQLTTQHGYSQQQFSNLKSLTNSFSNIFNAPKNDVDFVDVIFNNKLVYVLIPGMALSAQEAKMIGAFVVDSIKNGISKSLGSNVETQLNEKDKLKMHLFKDLQRRASPTFLMVLDEMAAFIGAARNSLELILAQARSVNVACVVSSQDVAGLSSGQDGMNFVDRILANTATKAFLKTADQSTLNKAKEIILNNIITIAEDGNQEQNNSNMEETLKFLQESKNGLGIIMSKTFDKFLTPFEPPKTDPDTIFFELNR